MTRKPLPVELENIDVSAGFSFVVAWRSGKTYRGGEIKVAEKVSEYLRAAAETTLGEFNSRQARPYHADMHLEDEEFLTADDEVTITESDLADILFPDQPLELLNAHKLPRSLLLYAIRFGVGDERLVFLSKTNPRVSARPGARLFALGDTLTRLGDNPVLQLMDRFELVVTIGGGVLGLSQRAFEDLFKFMPELQDHIPVWVAEIFESLPVQEGGLELMVEKCRTDSRLRRRVVAIRERGHLGSVSLDDIRQHVDEAGFDSGRFIQKDELVINAENPFDVLYLLNEDLFRGGLTKTVFRSDRKSPAS